MIMFLHLDISKFNAAMEQYLTPEYQGKMIVLFNERIGERDERYRAIAAVSQEAADAGLSRSSGISEAESMPGVILVRNRYYTYDALSRFLFNCLCDFLEDISAEVLSISKPHLDDIAIAASGDLDDAIGLKEDIRHWLESLGLRMSAAGISHSPRTAHFAAKIGKGEEARIIMREDITSYYERQAIAFPYIGEVLASRLGTHGIRTLGDIVRRPAVARKILGPRTGSEIYEALLPHEQLHLFPTPGVFCALDHYLGHRFMKLPSKTVSYHMDRYGRIFPDMVEVEHRMQNADEFMRLPMMIDLLGLRKQ